MNVNIVLYDEFETLDALGIANIFGASAGSAIIDIFGQNNWQFIFYINTQFFINCHYFSDLSLLWQVCKNSG